MKTTMKMAKKRGLLVVLLLIFASSIFFGKTLLNIKKAAKIGNEIILARDVKKIAKQYEISYEDAKYQLIGFTLLYLGAKVYVDEPTEEDINAQVKRDMAQYASRIGKSVPDLSEEEFLDALYMNNSSMKTYKAYIKKELWVGAYIDNEVEKAMIKPYNPTDKEIKDFIDKNPEFFEEKVGILLSMIYFSFLDAKSTTGYKNIDDIQKEKKDAKKCLLQLSKGARFEKLVEQYSDDLISSNAIPKGRVGKISLDDPRILVKFSQEIVNSLKSSVEGPIKKIFETKNGLYLFKIDKKIQAQKYSLANSKIKAMVYLKRIHEKNIRTQVKAKLLADLRKKFKVIIY